MHNETSSKSTRNYVNGIFSLLRYKDGQSKVKRRLSTLKKNF